MGTKLPSLGPNILKHLQKNVGPYKGRWIYALSWLLLLHESLSPSSALCLLSVEPGLKSFAAIWTCLNAEKKKRFFQKWLYHAGKTDTSIHCKSHKTSEGAAVSSLHESTITLTNSI